MLAVEVRHPLTSGVHPDIAELISLPPLWSEQSKRLFVKEALVDKVRPAVMGGDHARLPAANGARLETVCVTFSHPSIVREQPAPDSDAWDPLSYIDHPGSVCVCLCVRTHAHTQTSVFCIRSGAAVLPLAVFIQPGRDFKALLGDYQVWKVRRENGVTRLPEMVEKAMSCFSCPPPPVWADASAALHFTPCIKAVSLPACVKRLPGLTRSTSDKLLPVLTPQSGG